MWIRIIFNDGLHTPRSSFRHLLTETMAALPGLVMGDDFSLTKKQTVKH
jgi:hypothetical protein